MTGSMWVDLLVVVLAVLAAFSGYRQGAAASAMALLGVIIGVVAGVLVVPRVVGGIDDPKLRLLCALLLLVAVVIIGEVSGVVIGRAARSVIHSVRARRIDSVIGAVLQCIALLMAAWLIAIPIRSSSAAALASAVDGSAVIGGVDKVAPNWMRRLPDEFTGLLDSSGLKEVIGPFGTTKVASVDPPDQTLTGSAAVQKVRPSVVKIAGLAHQCSQALEGSGFVVGRQRVVTNAHVVAGTDEVSVHTESGADLPATVVLFDERNDVAVLDVPGLRARPLTFASDAAKTGDDAIVLGYPEDGPFTVTPVRVRNAVNLVGPDIRQDPKDIERDVYTVRGSIRSGNSGGPMITPDGSVLGVVFGAAEDPAEDTGFVLTAGQVDQDLKTAAGRSGDDTVATGACLTK
ncbi:MAG: MarP family serine protease [Gordonia sp. (in: high G+C Gram-positive bacteria)]|uniref:MarP family serine protease n=1 Tax=Gordonia sp. (in: high G+C Gram-positive bacteria) TaxID=84139 RepID=UPI0039E658C5